MIYYFKLNFRKFKSYIRYNVLGYNLKTNDGIIGKKLYKQLAEYAFTKLYPNLKPIITKARINVFNGLIVAFDFIDEEIVYNVDVATNEDIILFTIVSNEKFSKKDFLRVVKVLSSAYRRQAIGVKDVKNTGNTEEVTILYLPMSKAEEFNIVIPERKVTETNENNNSNYNINNSENVLEKT